MPALDACGKQPNAVPWKMMLPAHGIHATSPQNRRGFTILETLIALAVFSIFFTAVALIIQKVLQNIAEARIRSIALTVAQKRMEMIRNLPYDDVGTVGGIPSGPILQTESITDSGLPLTIQTSILFVDDPADGVAPADTVNTDYKRATIQVTWGGSVPSRLPITLMTNISPKRAEDALPGGTLNIVVYDALAVAVPGATVSLQSIGLTPEISMTAITDFEGKVSIPGLPPCASCYKLTATKTAYSADRTYGSDEVTNPIKPHATVLDGEVTNISFAIDRVSYLTVSSYNRSYAPVANVFFALKGSKLIGYDEYDLPVYKYTYSTNTGGYTVGIPSLEWDNYRIELTSSAHTLAGSDPMLPIRLAPGTSQTIRIVVAPKTAASLLVSVQNGIGERQADASVRLTSPPIGYDLTQTTAATGSADYGQTFFANLATQTYELAVNVPGYQEATASVVLTGNQAESIYLDTYEETP